MAHVYPITNSQDMSQLYVIKRGNRGREEVHFDKITSRLKHLSVGLNSIDPTSLALETIKRIYAGISTVELDNIAASLAEQKKIVHPDYGSLAARVCVSNLHKSTCSRFSEAMELIEKNLGVKGAPRTLDEIEQEVEKEPNTTYTEQKVYVGYFLPEAMAFIKCYAHELDSMIIHENDYKLDYFGFKTLEKSYLNAIKDKKSKIIIDRPQYIYMRVAIALYMPEKWNGPTDEDRKALEKIKVCYKLMSSRYFTPATPTLFNALTKNGNLASCYLLQMDDSAEGIMKCLTDAALISKMAGGIGVGVSQLRAKGQKIRGTNGEAAGILQMAKIANEVMRFYNQGGRRAGSLVASSEPHNPDFPDLINARLPHQDPDLTAKDIFTAGWCPDLLFKRATKGEIWSFFSDDTAPGLSDVYDGMDQCVNCGKYRHNAKSGCNHKWEKVNAYTMLYTRYEQEKRYVKQMPAQQLLNLICHALRETGTPYMMAKDSVNRKSNQSNKGPIKSSNLCCEIVEWSSSKSYATCTLSSVNLPAYLNPDGSYDFERLRAVVKQIVYNLETVINRNHYPVEECIENSQQLRPIGIGRQGLADLFCLKRIPFLSKEAEELDLKIAETMYYAALEASCDLAKELGPYKYWENSLASEGKLQFDIWDENNKYLGNNLGAPRLSLDWTALKEKIKNYGLRNSLLIADMPTVSTSQILGNNESFEPFSANIYSKNTLGGTYMVTNVNMIRHLIELGLWNKTIANKVLENEGSIAKITEIPKHIRDIYATVWELPQKQIMRRTALRTQFVDQAASLNIYLADNSDDVLRSVMIYGWQLGLKTISYYIRTKPAAKALKVVNVEKAEEKKEEEEAASCPIGCTSCSS